MGKISQGNYNMEGARAWKRAYMDANPDKRVQERFRSACRLVERAGGAISFPDQETVAAFFASEIAATKERAKARAHEREAGRA